MNDIEKLLSGDTDIIISALMPYVRDRASFDRCKLHMILTLVDLMRNEPMATVRTAAFKLNDHMHTTIRPIYGRLMMTKLEG